MKLQIFSDIHGDLAALARLLEVEADCYIAAGDLVSWGRGLDRIGAALSRRAGRVWLLPGNHESESDIAHLSSRYRLQNLHGRSFEAGGIRIAGLGYSNPTPFNTPGEYSEAELATRLAALAAPSPTILICHCPPKDTPLDRAGPGRHFGSTSIRDFILRAQPRYFFCGHIHEAEGVTATLGATFAANVGKRGFLLDLGAAESLSACVWEFR